MSNIIDDRIYHYTISDGHRFIIQGGNDRFKMQFDASSTKIIVYIKNASDTNVYTKTIAVQ